MEEFLCDSAHNLCEELVKRGNRPKALSIPQHGITERSLRIQHDREMRELIEIASLCGFSDDDVSFLLENHFHMDPLTPTEVREYRSIFWNTYPEDGWGPLPQRYLQKFLRSDKNRANHYQRHLHWGFGERTRLDVAIELGLPWSRSDQLFLNRTTSQKAYRNLIEALDARNSPDAGAYAQVVFRLVQTHKTIEQLSDPQGRSNPFRLKPGEES